MLTPADIGNKQFSATRLKEGYDQREVDDFLDRVQEDYAFLAAQVARLDSENATLRRTRASEAPTVMLDQHRPEPPSVVAQRLIEAAEVAAQEHEAEGRARADEIVRKAGGEGARIVEEATAAAERIKSEALAEKYRRNEELDRQHTDLARAVSDLQAKGEGVRNALADALSSIEGRL